MACNNIGREGAISQVKCLKERDGVSHIQLSNNCLNDDIGSYIAETLRGNTSIKSIDVINNPNLSIATIVKIGQAIMTNTGVDDINQAITSSFSNKFLDKIASEQNQSFTCHEYTILGGLEIDSVGSDFFD